MNRTGLNEHIKKYWNILAPCSQSLEIFAKTFFSKSFPLPFSPKIHKPIFDMLDNRNLHKIAIAAPRGIGKSSIMNKAYAARALLFQQCKCMLLIGCSADRAIAHSNNLKDAILNNPLITEIFEDQKTNDFTQQKWTTAYGTTVYALGSGQPVRGILEKDVRPDLVIVDDLEDPEEASSEVQRTKLMKWFLGDLLNVFDDSNPNNRILVLGTITGRNSLLNNLVRNSFSYKDIEEGKHQENAIGDAAIENWSTAVLEICDENLISHWPEKISTERLQARAGLFKRLGQYATFLREHRNIAVDSEDSRRFTDSMFKYYDEDELSKTQNLINIICVDPAKTTKSRSDYTAIISVSIDIASDKIYITEVFNGRVLPDEQISITMDMGERHDAKLIAVETTGLDEFVAQPFKTAINQSKRYHPEFMPIRSGRKKEDRIRSLLAYYNPGLIYHNPRFCTGLEEQLISFPDGDYDDIADCVANVLLVMENLELYFDSVYAKAEQDANRRDEIRFREIYKEDLQNSTQKDLERLHY